MTSPNVVEFKFTGRIDSDVLRSRIAGAFGVGTWEDLMVKVSVQGVTAAEWDDHEKEEATNIDKAAKEISEMLGGLIDSMSTEQANTSDTPEKEAATKR